MTKTGRIARVLPLALLAATALTSQAWAVGCPGTPYASYTTLLDSLDTSLTFNCQTGKLGITLGTPSQLGGYTLGSGLQAPSGALGVLYGRSANTALQGNDPAVAAALTAVQPAALTAAIAAIPASNNVAIGLVSGTARDAAAAIQAETTALNAANAAQSTANGAATAAALTGETQRAQIAEAGKVSTSSLATVAFSGSYNDLANKPGTVSFPGGALTSGTGTSVAVGTGLSLTGGVLNASGSGGGTTYTGSGPVVVSGTTISLGAPSGVTPGATLAKAAFTGAYSDLSGLPTLLAIGTTTGTAADGGALATTTATANAALPKAGGSITGDLMVVGTGRFGSTTATGFPTIDVDGTAAAQRQHTFSTAGALRWVEGVTGGTEPGSNVGSDFFISGFNDAGALIAKYLTINRATGVATITHDPVAALDVATKQYVDAHAGSGGSAPTPIVNTYTASGAIAPTDTLSLINCSSACTMTLAQGADTHRIVVKRIGAAVTLTGTFDRTSQSIAMNSSGTILDSVVLDEVAAISSYIVE